MDILDRIASQLDGKRTGNNVRCKCPAHDDKNPSCDVDMVDGKMLVICRAGCSQDDVIEMLKERHLWPSNASGDVRHGPASPTHSPSFTTATTTERLSPDFVSTRTAPAVPAPAPVYIYRDESGEPYLGKQSKTEGMKQMHYKDGSWWFGKNGRAPLLYNLPEVLSETERTVFVVEGEKCAERVRACGEIATTSGGSTSWKPEFAQYLAGRNVVILPDNDEAGAEYAQKVAESLKGVAKSCLVVELEGLGDKEDICEYLDVYGHDFGDVWGLVNAKRAEGAPKGDFITLDRWFEEGEEEPVPIIHNFWDKGLKLTVIGPSKQRKTFFTLQLLMSLLDGKEVFGLQPAGEFRVMLVQLEVPRQHFYKRCRRMAESLGIHNTHNLSVWNARGQDFSFDRVRGSAEEFRPDIIALDPFYKLHNGNENSGEDINETLREFDMLAEKTGASIMYIHHDAKGTAGDRSTMDRGSGSGYVGRDIDVSFVLTPHKSQDANLVVVETGQRNYENIEPFCLEFNKEKMAFEVSAEEAEKYTSEVRNSNPTTYQPNSDFFEDISKRVWEHTKPEPLKVQELKAWMREGLKLSHRKAEDCIREFKGRADGYDLEFWNAGRTQYVGPKQPKHDDFELL